MKVRFAPQSIRCRTTRGELRELLHGRALVLEVRLPRDHVFRVNVRASPLEKWQLDSDPTGLWLTVPMTELQNLFESPPSREGLRHAFEISAEASVDVSLEIDLRDRSSD